VIAKPGNTEVLKSFVAVFRYH